MPKNINKTKKKQEKFQSDNKFLNLKILNYFNFNSFSTYRKKFIRTTKFKPNQTLFDRT